MLKTLMNASLALALVAGTMVSTTPSAEARGGRTAGAVAGAIIGLGVLGAYAASRERGHRHHYRSCYAGRERCEVAGQRCWYNRHGEYRCKDEVRCHRPQICE